MSPKTEHRRLLLDGNISLSYTLERKDVKNINMRMRPETGLMVSAPYGVPIRRIEAVLRQNQSRIIEILRRYAAQQEKKVQQYPLTYTSGETVLYLGQMYRLEAAAGTGNTVQIQDGRLLLIVKDLSDGNLRKRVFDTWWKTACKKAVDNLCRAVYPIYEKHGVPFPKEIRFREMTAQWGNCRPNQGILTFNTRLLAAPVRCMEYVVLHEFTHFLHKNHSQAFYAFMEKELPDWKNLQETLQNIVETRNFRGEGSDLDSIL